MPYVAVKLLNYETDSFIGYAIRNTGSPDRLESTVYYSQYETAQLDQRLAELNESERLAPFWPNANDGQVQELIKDPQFCTEFSFLSDDLTVQFKRYQEAARVVARDRAEHA